MQARKCKSFRAIFCKGGLPVATTRIIPMHVNKGKTIAQCLTERTDYAKNPDKTEDGEYISA